MTVLCSQVVYFLPNPFQDREDIPSLEGMLTGKTI